MSDVEGWSVTLDFMTENGISVQWMTKKEMTVVSDDSVPTDGRELGAVVGRMVGRTAGFVTPVWSLPYFPLVLFESRSEISRAWCCL